MRILIATAKTPFISGGAEAHAASLHAALLRRGHEVETFAFPFNPRVPERVLEQMLACRLIDVTEINGQKIDRLIALKFPAYLIPHPNKVVWLLHQHRSAYDLWDHAAGDLSNAPRGLAAREAIRRADRLLASARKVFANSKTVADRLRHFCQIDSSPLYHPPPDADDFRCESALGDYIFFPSRLHPTKRQTLVLQALALTRHPVRVRFAGLPDDTGYDELLHGMAAELRVASRVEWMRYITHPEKVDSYARAIAVLYPAMNEDYGYVTLEAMLSSKAVIACVDSGGPLEFVVSGKTGLVAEPTAASLASALDQLWQDRALALNLGAAGRRHYEGLGLSWDATVDRLLG